MRAYQSKERKLVNELKPLLPTHAGEARYQAALDGDRKFREMVLAAFALALFGGTGFGQMAATAGPTRSALLCITAAGFALRSISFRTAVPRAGNLVDGPPLRLVAVTVIGYGILGSLLGGLYGLVSMAIVVVATIATAVVSARPGLRPLGYALACLALVGASIWKLGLLSGSIPILGIVAGFSIGSACVAISLIANSNQGVAYQPTMVMTSIAGFAWIFWTASAAMASPWNLVAAVFGCLVLAFVERQLSARASFAPIVIALVLLQFSGCAGAVRLPPKTVAPMLVALTLEFCLVGMAGYRHAIASLRRYPHATYRSSPQCLVPSLDHAWDHPIKIDAV